MLIYNRIMKNTKENFIMNSIRDPFNPYHEAVNEVMDYVVTFWEVTDYLFHTDYSKIFSALYLSPEYAEMTAVQLCFRLNISESSLYRTKKLLKGSVICMLEKRKLLPLVKAE